jgi:hypothetical protein
MKSITKIWYAFGFVLLAFTAGFRFYFAERIERPDFCRPIWSAIRERNMERDGGGIPVVMWSDWNGRKLQDSIRIDVIDGEARARDGGSQIGDVESYVNVRVKGPGQRFVIITATDRETIGSVIHILDQCRKTRATAVILNELSVDLRPGEVL